MEEVNGRGSLGVEGERLIFRLDYGSSDAYTFECVRSAKE